MTNKANKITETIVYLVRNNEMSKVTEIIAQLDITSRELSDTVYENLCNILPFSLLYTLYEI